MKTFLMTACLFLAAAGVSAPLSAGVGIWTSRGPGPVRPVIVDPVSPQVVYAGDREKVYRSDDGGQTWIESVTVIGGPAGLGSEEILTLAIDSTNPQFLYAGKSSSCPANFGSVVFKSFDGGRHWFQAQPGIGCLSVQVIAPDPSRPGTPWAGTVPTIRNTFAGTHRSDDGGLTWQRPGTPPPCTGVSDVFVKILDARSVDGHFWVFHSGLTDLGYVLSVTDTVTGLTRNYRKEPGAACGGFETSHF